MIGKLIAMLIIGIGTGCWIGLAIGVHSKPGTTIYPTRPEMQMFLREHYAYPGDIDGKIGSLSNDSWLLYEEDLMNYDQARYIERMGGGE